MERDFKHIAMECRCVKKMAGGDEEAGPKPVEKSYVQVRTVCSHIENMIVGVTRGFTYKMQFVYSHFPINVSLTGDTVEIRNFLGERPVRKVKLSPGVKYARSDSVKDQIELSGIDIAAVSLVAAKIQQSTNMVSMLLKRELHWKSKQAPSNAIAQ
jgi:large subunit ribosomal protein L9e